MPEPYPTTASRFWECTDYIWLRPICRRSAPVLIGSALLPVPHRRNLAAGHVWSQREGPWHDIAIFPRGGWRQHGKTLGSLESVRQKQLGEILGACMFVGGSFQEVFQELFRVPQSVKQNTMKRSNTFSWPRFLVQSDFTGFKQPHNPDPLWSYITPLIPRARFDSHYAWQDHRSHPRGNRSKNARLWQKA